MKRNVKDLKSPSEERIATPTLEEYDAISELLDEAGYRFNAGQSFRFY